MVQKLSITKTFNDREELERLAKTFWEDLGNSMGKLIPESLRTFANEKGWIKNDIWWQLPMFLECLVRSTRIGGCNNEEYYKTDLEVYGFTSFDDLKAKFVELAEVWKGLIRIVVDDSESHCIKVSYYAVETVDELEGQTSIPDGPDPEVRDHGVVMFMTDTIDSRKMEDWVQKVTKISGQRVDWYCSGKHIVRALGDMTRVMGAIMLLMPEHDDLWRNSVKALNAGLEDMDPPRPAWWPSVS